MMWLSILRSGEYPGFFEVILEFYMGGHSHRVNP